MWVWGIQIYGYGIVMAIALGTGLWMSERIKGKIDGWLLFLVGLGAILGARTYHVVDQWPIYQQNWQQIVAIRQGGMGIWGALAGGAVGIWVYSKVNKSAFLGLSDRIVIGLPLAQAIGRIGNWINQEGFGPPTDLFWKIYIDVGKRPPAWREQSYFHPVFGYEAILDMLLFAVILKQGRKKQAEGVLTAVYMMGYGVIRLVTERWRYDTWVWEGIKMSNVWSIVAICIGGYLLIKKRRR